MEVMEDDLLIATEVAVAGSDPIVAGLSNSIPTPKMQIVSATTELQLPLYIWNSFKAPKAKTPEANRDTIPAQRTKAFQLSKFAHHKEEDGCEHVDKLYQIKVLHFDYLDWMKEEVLATSHQ